MHDVLSGAEENRMPTVRNTPGAPSPRRISLRSRATVHPGRGRSGRMFGADRLPPDFHTVFDADRDHPFRDLPPPTGLPPFHLDLASILHEGAIQEIHTAGKLVFHAVGDTGGVNTPTPIETVAAYMERDFTTRNPS